MTDSTKSFADLVAEAPEAAGSTVSLVGTLARAAEEGKFVLNMGDGRALTLDTSAVKGHAVLGTSVGQTLVRVDVDSTALPAEAVPAAPPVAHTTTATDHPLTVAWFDVHTHAHFDTPHTIPVADTGTGLADIGVNTLAEGIPDPTAGGVTPAAFTLNQSISAPALDHPHTLLQADYTVSYLDHPHTYFWFDHPVGTGVADVAGNTLAETIPDPFGGIQQAAAVAPFALAAPQQVPQATMAALGVTPSGRHTIAFHDNKTIADHKALVDSGATNIGSRFLD